MEPLKEMFNKEFYERLAIEFEKVYSFNTQSFVKEVTQHLNALSLNQRMRNTSMVLAKYLPDDFKKSIQIMMEVIPNLGTGYTTMIFPDYVSLFGIPHFDASMEALKYFTSFGSSEFAIREFLRHNFSRTIRKMYEWSEDENKHVRRLASEGSRPRLPWSFKLEEVIKDPSVTAPILQNLKADPELYVRKSVANHLNDLSKDSPGYVLDTLKTWDKTHPHTAWIIKRGCRTLIKKGDKRSFILFDCTENAKVTVETFKIRQTTIRLNESLSFELRLSSKSKKAQKLIIDYCIYYRKKSKELSPKVFKLKEIELYPGEHFDIIRKQLFKDFTTRKHYGGKHLLELIINGKTMAKKEFILKV